jgi:hypothetical protein
MMPSFKSRVILAIAPFGLRGMTLTLHATIAGTSKSEGGGRSTYRGCHERLS